jgi:hypothetical protein
MNEDSEINRESSSDYQKVHLIYDEDSSDAPINVNANSDRRRT